MRDLHIAVEDPRAGDVQRLLQRHHEFAHAHTPVAHIHALGVDGLLEASVTFFAARRDGELVAIGALKELDATHGELKSMHTVETMRGNGIGRAVVDHLLDMARARGYERVSLETGTTAAFAPAHALYTRCGFVPCEPFGDYVASPSNTFMTLDLLRTVDYPTTPP